MDSDTLKEAVRLARTIGHVFVATADHTGMPHMAVMNGYVPATNDEIALPQVERRLLVRVDKVIDFSCAPHTDVEE
jgi:hypothetical protein